MFTNGLPLGKFGRKQFERFIRPYLTSDQDLLVPPEFGSDFAALEVSENKVLVVSTDPLSISRELGWERSGKLALQVAACDVAASGISPGYVSPNWNLPSHLEDETFEHVWKAFCEEAQRENIIVIGGHTGRYEGPGLPITGAATVFGVGKRSDLLEGEKKAGDVIASFGTPGLEAAGILSFYFPKKVKEFLKEEGLTTLREKYNKIRPTKTLNLLSSIPGVKKLHDLGEGGLIGGAQELLEEAGPGIKLVSGEIPIPKEVEKVCRGLELDPLRVTSTGAGLAVLRKKSVDKILEEADRKGLNLAEIGKLTEKGELELISNQDKKVLEEPVRDQFWNRLKNLSSKR